MNKIKVMVVDDSALMRKIISDMLNRQLDIEVIGIARNGQELLSKLETQHPDVITLDVEMPKMNGIEALKELKLRNINIPVIMLSSISKRGAELTMECLEAGAFDFIPKPSGSISLDIDKVLDDLTQKIRLAYNKKSLGRINKSNEYKSVLKSFKRDKEFVGNSPNHTKRIQAIVIGASTGGPKSLHTIIKSLPQKLGVPIIIVQHMPVGFTKAFAKRLNNNSNIEVVEAIDGDNIERDKIYIAPGGFHLEISKDKKICLNTDKTIWGVRPAVDKLFISASKVYGSSLMSIILTGMGKDGANGTVEVKKMGGYTISEDESTCIIYGMPKMAYATGMVDIALPLKDIPLHIVKSVMGVRR